MAKKPTAALEHIAPDIRGLARPLSDFTPDPANARRHPERNLEAIRGSLARFGQRKPIVTRPVNGTLVVVAGNGTLEAAKALGWTHLAASVQEMTDAEATAYAIADNRTAELAEWDEGVLAGLLGSLDEELQGITGFDDAEIQALISDAAGGTDGDGESKKLADRFLVPPFTVLDARQGYWQDRKRQWLSLGIMSEAGREVSGAACTTGKNSAMNKLTGRLAPGGGANDGEHVTSIFDPVLCELAYRWFSPPDGHILDPFAGGSVRGIVAAKLGRQYVGVDLSARQIEANREQAQEIIPDAPPVWVNGDSTEIATLAKGQYDLVFSCPPYFDLEEYSDSKQDLSAMSWTDFLTAYRKIVAACISMLKPNRFACFVVGDVRDDHGIYRNFTGETVRAFEDAGARLYNEAILVTSLGSLPIRAGKQFESGRKLGKTHQNVYVFCKGDPIKATAACGKIEINLELGGDDADQGQQPV